MTEYRRTPDGIVVPEREIRRAVAPAPEVRTDGDTITIEGYAIVYDVDYDVAGLFTERMARGAASKAAQESDVRLYFNHGGIPLARTKSGTMRLTSDDVGLLVSADMSKRSRLAMDLVDAMEREDIDEMSVGFRAIRQDWDYRNMQRTLREVGLFDVTITPEGANGATHVQVADDEQVVEPMAHAGTSVRFARSVIETRPIRV